MSFINYLKNMLIDIGVIVLGLLLVIVGFAFAVAEMPLLGLGIVVLGVVSMLYSRYRKTQQGITY